MASPDKWTEWTKKMFVYEMLESGCWIWHQSAKWLILYLYWSDIKTIELQTQTIESVACYVALFSFNCCTNDDRQLVNHVWLSLTLRWHSHNIFWIKLLSNILWLNLSNDKSILVSTVRPHHFISWLLSPFLSFFVIFYLFICFFYCPWLNSWEYCINL